MRDNNGNEKFARKATRGSMFLATFLGLAATLCAASIIIPFTDGWMTILNQWIVILLLQVGFTLFAWGIAGFPRVTITHPTPSDDDTIPLYRNGKLEGKIRRNRWGGGVDKRGLFDRGEEE